MIDFTPYVLKHAKKIAVSFGVEDLMGDIRQEGFSALVAYSALVDEARHPGQQVNYITRCVLGSMLDCVPKIKGTVAMSTHAFKDPDKKEPKYESDTNIQLFLQAGDSPEQQIINKQDHTVYQHIMEFRAKEIRYPDTFIWDKCVMDGHTSRAIGAVLDLHHATIARRVLALKQKFKEYVKEVS